MNTKKLKWILSDEYITINLSEWQPNHSCFIITSVTEVAIEATTWLNDSRIIQVLALFIEKLILCYYIKIGFSILLTF